MRFCAAILVLAAFSLSACFGSAPPVPRDHFYRIVAPTPAQVEEHIAYKGIMAVNRLSAEGLLRERPLLFSATGRSHEVQQHDYHYWSDPPTSMVQEALVDYLRQSGLAETVIGQDLRIQADYEVVGRIKRLERLLGGGPPRVVAEIDLSLLDRATEELLLSRTYMVELPSADASVDASVVAFNQAMAEILTRFLADARQG
jgi:cholesterol transport system auxiliary component